MSKQTSPTIAVTGAAGYIGSRVITLLQEAHPRWSIVALDNFYRGRINQVGDVSVEHVDVRDRARLENHLDGSDIVMHLAAVSGVEDCERNNDFAYEVNVTGTSNVAWFCRRTGAGLIFPYSMAVLGDPTQFPITVDQQRDPLNWYGRTKLLGEQLVEQMADSAFPAHLYMKSNLYGEHAVGSTTVSKETVVNFFVDRALAGEPLTVYEPGTQSRNYVHVDDVARIYVRSAERLLDQRQSGVTGVEKYEVASDETLSVHDVAKLVREITASETDRAVGIELVENPRSSETLVEEFTVDTSTARNRLGWEPRHSLADSIEGLLTEQLPLSKPTQ